MMIHTSSDTDKPQQHPHKMSNSKKSSTIFNTGSAGGAVSYTAPTISASDRAKELETAVTTSKVCIALDWLSVYYKQKDYFKIAMNEGDTQIINDDCYFLCIDRPTLHFNQHLVLMYKREECAHILYDSRNEKFFDKDVCKVEFKNHTLYSGQWQEIADILTAQGLEYKSASRIDICIDGVNYLQELLNVYSKQTKSSQVLRLKNSSERRARFSAKVLNPRTMNFENFNIGTQGGNKMITVYNKSLEIARSGKTYIQEYWFKNGVIAELSDYEKIAKELERAEKGGHEKMYLDGYTNIYRFEIRLKSEAIKEIENFTLDMLKTKQGLASIVKCHCKNYFEMQYNNNENVSRCTAFELLPYAQLEAEQIYKIERVEKDGEYKAKMLMHGIVQDIYKGNVKPENMNECIEVIIDRAAKYNLTNYLEKKLEEWAKKYSPATATDRINEVIIIIEHLKGRATELTHDFNDLASRHGQADATAHFGDY